MYDKYYQAQTFTVNTRLPKHKGILFSGATAGTNTSIPVNFINGGGTLGATLSISLSPYILPMQLYSVLSLPSGMTAWCIN